MGGGGGGALVETPRPLGSPPPRPGGRGATRALQPLHSPALVPHALCPALTRCCAPRTLELGPGALSQCPSGRTPPNCPFWTRTERWAKAPLPSHSALHRPAPPPSPCPGPDYSQANTRLSDTVLAQGPLRSVQYRTPTPATWAGGSRGGDGAGAHWKAGDLRGGPRSG